MYDKISIFLNFLSSREESIFDKSSIFRLFFVYFSDPLKYTSFTRYIRYTSSQRNILDIPVRNIKN